MKLTPEITEHITHEDEKLIAMILTGRLVEAEAQRAIFKLILEKAELRWLRAKDLPAKVDEPTVPEGISPDYVKRLSGGEIAVKVYLWLLTNIRFGNRATVESMRIDLDTNGILSGLRDYIAQEFDEEPQNIQDHYTQVANMRWGSR